VSIEGRLPPDGTTPPPVVEGPIEEKAVLDMPEAEEQAEAEPQTEEKTKAELKPKAEAGAKAEAQVDNSIFEQLEQAWEDTEIAEPTDKPEVVPAEAISQPEGETADKTTVALDEATASTTYEGRLELDILPPLAPNQLVEIQRYLRDWPGIGIIELGPKSGGYSITISLDKPMPLIDILKQLPDIEMAEERVDSGDGHGETTPDKKGLKRIAITLCRTK
jgi:hypothetical protein